MGSFLLFNFLLFSSFSISFCYITVTKYTVGNKTYFERFEQPWFRIMHYDHDRIKPDEKEDSAFGKHYVPEDDKFIMPDWPKREEEYMGCLNRTCVCGFYNGTVKPQNGPIEKQECYLPNGKLLKRAVRTELRMLPNDHRKMIEKAWNIMKKNGVYNRIGRVHKYSGVHSGPGFTLWHREFLKRLEMVLREYNENPDLGIPYWDSTLDSLLPEPRDSIIFSEIFLGETDENGFVKNGPYYNWPTMEDRPQILRLFWKDDSGEMLNNPRVEWLVNNPDINMILGATMPLSTCPMNHTLDARMLEFQHDYVHFLVNGDMSKSYSSSNDITFVYHHSMIDWIFEEWRQTMQTRAQRETDYPKTDETCFPFWHNYENDMPLLYPLRNRDALSNGYTDYMYEYSPRATCSREKPDCKSEYLFCYVPEDPKEWPSCVSKVRRNGRCDGFEKYPICYWGSCVDGRCDEKTKFKPKNNDLKNYKKFGKDIVPFIM